MNRITEIIDVSARLISQKGYSATSIRDIGKALGVTSAALYYHFKNKDEVLTGIMLEGLRVVTQAVNEATAKETGTWNQIQAAMHTHLSMSLEHRDFASVLLHDMRHLNEASFEQVVQMRDAYEVIWTELLEQGRSEGIIRPDIDLHLLRLMIFGAMNHVVYWHRPSGEYPIDDIAEVFLKTLSEGVIR